MPSSYPGAADSFGAPAGSDPQSTPVGGRTHSQSHTDLGDAVEAIEAELGLNPSGAAATVAARLDALDAAWPAADAAHVAAGDPHPQYETSAEATAKVSAHAGASDPHGDRAYAAALVDDLSGVTNASTARTNLGLGDAATKNVGTAAGTVAAGDDSRITGALPASLVDAKGDLIAASADNTPARLPVGAEGDVLTVWGSASTGLVWAQPQPRNLLTVNQSSIETNTTGLAATTNCTIASTTAAGTFDGGAAALAVTSSAAGSVVAGTLTGTSGVPVVAGRLYSAVLTAKSAVITSNASARIRWWTSGGAAVSTTTGTASALTTSAFGLRFVAGLAPATAAYATVEFTWTAAGASEVVYLDCLGLWEGYGGTWALGGQPIQGVGERWDETVGRRCFRWNPLLNSGAGGEQMVYGDTGYRDIAALAVADAGRTLTYLRLRRHGTQVTLRYQILNTVTASSLALLTASLPSGFRPTSTVTRLAPRGATAAADSMTWLINTAGNVDYYVTSASTFVGQIEWSTEDSWPTTLPGTTWTAPSA